MLIPLLLFQMRLAPNVDMLRCLEIYLAMVHLDMEHDRVLRPSL